MEKIEIIKIISGITYIAIGFVLSYREGFLSTKPFAIFGAAFVITTFWLPILFGWVVGTGINKLIKLIR